MNSFRRLSVLLCSTFLTASLFPSSDFRLIRAIPTMQISQFFATCVSTKCPDYAPLIVCGFFIAFVMLSSGTWSFMSYFDDHYNYELHKDVFTFRGNPFDQFFKMVYHVGINVYEPVGSLLKGSAITILGPNPLLLRFVSLSIHVLNFVLLLRFTNLFMRNVHSRTTRFSYVFIYLIFLIHPLNAEVIGWLSAQSYTVALTFSLLSCINIELMLSDECQDKDLARYMAMSTIYYALSCLVSCCSDCSTYVPYSMMYI